ncbi:lipopolysaccharide assembly protein LapA domain-containing protein [Enterococcus faecalis]
MHSVTINFIFFSMKFPLLFLILVLFLLGMFSGWMVKQKDIKKTIESVKDGLK